MWGGGGGGGGALWSLTFWKISLEISLEISIPNISYVNVYLAGIYSSCGLVIIHVHFFATRNMGIK